jgi:phage terminase small subunit
MAKAKLHERHKRFALEYIKDLNGTQAAIRAGYAESCAVVTAAKHLANPKIKAYVQELMDERAKRVKIDADTVLSNIKDIACSKDYGPDRPIRASDVLKANELLGKHLKLFTDKIEVEGKLSLEQLVVESNEGKE